MNVSLSTFRLLSLFVIAVAAAIVRFPGLLSTAAADEKPSTPTMTRKDLSESEMKRLVSHMPEQFRKGVSDAELVKELETISFAFDFKGGPIDLWLEIEEHGQKTMAKVYTHTGARGGWKL